MNNKIDDTEKIGQNVTPYLAKLISDCVDAAKKVEADGASYRHMPDWFKARGAVVIYIHKEIERQVLEGRVDELKDISDSDTHLEWIQLSRQKTLSGGIGVATFIDKRLAKLRKLQEGKNETA